MVIKEGLRNEGIIREKKTKNRNKKGDNSNSSSGAKYERQIVNLMCANDLLTWRVEGSGAGNQRPSADVIGWSEFFEQIICIELKTKEKACISLHLSQIEQLTKLHKRNCLVYVVCRFTLLDRNFRFLDYEAISRLYQEAKKKGQKYASVCWSNAQRLPTLKQMCIFWKTGELAKQYELTEILKQKKNGVDKGK